MTQQLPKTTVADSSPFVPGLNIPVQNKKAIVSLSGGLDSTTLLALVTSLGYEVYAISFDYGQRSRFELPSARKIAKKYDVKKHLEYALDLRVFGGSSLTDDLPVAESRSESEIATSGIPLTYVPMRNTIFLSLALAWAETLAITDLFIGVNAVDYSGYPDCRPEFIQAFEHLANTASKMTTSSEQSIRIHAPLIHMSKSQIIDMGLKLGVDYSETSSCYNPCPSSGKSCGVCDSCILRQRAFQTLGLLDPLVLCKFNNRPNY